MQVVYLQNMPIKVHTICNRTLIVGIPPPPQDQKLLSKHKTTFPTILKQKLTPYPSNPPPPHPYGLPKIHKTDIPLRPIVSSIGFPCYALAGFLHKILSPLSGKSKTFVKNSSHFIQLLRSVNLESTDILVSFDVVNLFTNVPVEEAYKSSVVSSRRMRHWHHVPACRWMP
jgi:hypothetical protein